MNKENILISSCLLGKNCKYNGTNNLQQGINNLQKRFNFIEICPEVMGGLSIPRYPSEIKNHQVINSNKENVTKEFILGANESLKLAKIYQCKYAILKSNSPSCGFGLIYDGNFNKTLIKGNGITAELLYQNGIVVLNENNFKDILK